MRSKKETEMKTESGENLSLKIQFYVLSLWLLFILIFLLTIDIPISFDKNATFIGIIPLLKRNWLAVISLVMISIGLIIMSKMKHDFKGVHNPVAKLTKLKNGNYEYLTFITTYIIPLVCINLNEIRYVIVLGILLIIIGSIFVKMDLYLGNPSLALLGYHLYLAEVEGISSEEGVLIISRDKLSINSYVKWIQISKFVWVAKENKK